MNDETDDKEIQDAKKLIAECNFKEYVKIYSNDSNLIKILGTVFHNKRSREMWMLLSSSNKEYYLKEMAVIIEKNENPRLPIYQYHIDILVKAGIVLTRIKLHNKHKTKFYRAAPVIMLTAPHIYEKASKSKTLKNTFQKVFKFAAIGFVALGIHAFSQFINKPETTTMTFDLLGDSNFIVSLIIPLLVIICGLIGVRIHSHFKNKKKLKQFNSFFDIQ